MCELLDPDMLTQIVWAVRARKIHFKKMSPDNAIVSLVWEPLGLTVANRKWATDNIFSIVSVASCCEQLYSVRGEYGWEWLTNNGCG